MSAKRVLVTGGRDYADRARVFSELDTLARGFGVAVVIHGACSDAKGVLRGADRWADEWARAYGVEVIPCPADWDRHGKAAGPRRNGDMLRNHAPTLVLAFPGGRGTEDMMQKAVAAKVTLIMVDPSAPLSPPEPAPPRDV